MIDLIFAIKTKRGHIRLADTPNYFTGLIYLGMAGESRNEKTDISQMGSKQINHKQNYSIVIQTSRSTIKVSAPLRRSILALDRFSHENTF